MSNDKGRTSIVHRGKVKSVDGDVVTVSIISESACVSCRAHKVCSASDMKEKEITAKSREPFAIGEEVDVMISQTTGYKAVFLAYILPVILIVAFIVGIIGAGFSEGIAGIGAIILLFLYFFVLYLLRDKMNDKVKIEIINRK